MRSDIFFQLYGITPLGIDFERRPVDYTTEKGFHVWINQGNDELPSFLDVPAGRVTDRGTGCNLALKVCYCSASKPPVMMTGLV